MGDEPQCACAPSSWSRRSARSGLPGAARLWERPAVPGPAVESRPPPPVGRYDAGEGDLLLSAGGVWAANLRGGARGHGGGALAALGCGVWRLNLRGGADVHVTLDGRERRGHAVLVEDPDQAAEEFAALLNRVGPRPLGVKLHVARAPTTAEVKAALGGRGVAHLRLTD